MRFLITGGAGFIGSALASYLLKKGNKVTVFDNLSNSSENQASALSKNGATFVKGDITIKQDIENAISNHDFLIHLAAQIDVNESIKNPDYTYKVNVEGTKNILDACKKNQIKNVLAASSAAVYGIQKTLPIKEGTDLKPISPYGQSKIKMENLLKDYSRNHNLNCISLRFFNIYGPGQSDAYAGVITKFISNISNNQPLTIFGDGSFTRDFISIDDVINSITKSVEKIENKKGNCYNIATGKQTSILQLANLLLKVSKKDLEIKHQEAKEGDIPFSCADIALAQKELDFTSKINLSEGLEKLFTNN